MTKLSPEAEVAVLQQKVTDISSVLGEMKGDLKEIKGFIASLDNHYITRDEFTAFKKQYWLSHTLTAVVTAVFTALIYHFITQNRLK